MSDAHDRGDSRPDARDAARVGADASDDLDAMLLRAPAPPLDPALAARALRRARGALPLPGEGSWSLAGLGVWWDTALAPALVLLAGAAYTLAALAQIALVYAS